MTSKIQKIIVISGIILAVLFIGWAIMDRNNYFWLLTNKVWQSINGEKTYKISLCEAEVLSQLKAPWSAKFWERNYDGFFYLKNYVDSQNSYWALLRIKFVCAVTNWKVTVIFDSEDPNLHALYKISAWE